MCTHVLYIHTPARSQHGHPVRLPFFLNRHQIVPHRNARGVFHFMHRKQRGRVTNQSHGRTFGTQYNHTFLQNTLQKKYNFVKNQVPNNKQALHNINIIIINNNKTSSNHKPRTVPSFRQLANQLNINIIIQWCCCC